MLNGYIESAQRSVDSAKQTLQTLRNCRNALSSAVNPNQTMIMRVENLIADQQLDLEKAEVILRNLSGLK